MKLLGPWCVVRAREELFSATNRNALSSLSFGDALLHGMLVPEFLVGFLRILQHSSLLEHLMMPMYQEPTRMIIRMISVPWPTKSPAARALRSVGVLDGFGCRRRDGGR